MIYLDYAANHPAEPEVLARFCAVESAFPGNPNSAHPAGRAAKAELERVTAVDSELGVVQPIPEMREILKDFPNCRLHVDAT